MNTKHKQYNVLVTYGSAQGTTARIAEVIIEGMNNAGASASAVRIDLLSMMPDRVLTADILGIGFPVYFLREPRYIDELISSFPSLDGKKAFIFCTCGLNNPGETFHRTAELLSQRGANVIGAEYFPSVMSYLPYRKRGYGNKENLPDDDVFVAAHRFGEQIVNGSTSISLQPETLATQLQARLLANKTVRKLFLPGIRINDDLCTGYGQCMTRCPFLGLARHDEEDEEEIPFLTDNCIQCLQCIDWCPKSAIEIDSRSKDMLSMLLYHLKLH
jgi:ferredoxin/flavodoxin